MKAYARGFTSLLVFVFLVAFSCGDGEGSQGGLEQACHDDGTCDGALICEGGVCVEPSGEEGGLGQPCYPDDSCDESLVCEGGVCVELGGEEGGLGQPCYPDDSCDSPYACREGTCVQTLEGTSLEGLDLQWDEPLELCNAWQENESLEAERSRKVRIVVSASERASLDQVDLGRASLEKVLVERGPMADERWPVSNGEIASELTNWEITEPTEDSCLDAELRHELGDRGTLIESLIPCRRGDDDSPLNYTGGKNEVSFRYLAPGANDPFPLEQCGGGPSHEDAISLLVGTAGDEVVALTRYWRALDEENGEGAQPVIIDASEIWTREDPWRPIQARGMWAHTYSALESNLYENSEIDLSRDLVFYHLLFRHLEMGGEIHGDFLGRVDLLDLRGSEGEASIELTWLTEGTGAPRTESFAPRDDGHWRRVDNHYLQHKFLEEHCADGRVITLGQVWSSTFQALTCLREDAPGFDVVGLIPVAFRFEPLSIGVLFDGDAISETLDPDSGNVRFEIDVGEEHGVHIEVTGNDSYLLRVWEGDSHLLEMLQCQEDVLSRRTIPDQTLEFESTDGGITLRFGRGYGAQGAGETWIYVPLFFEMQAHGEHFRVDAWDRLHYTSTHNNWADELQARTDSTELRWRTEGLSSNGSWKLHYFVHAVDRETGVEFWPETEVAIVE